MGVSDAVIQITLSLKTKLLLSLLPMLICTSIVCIHIYNDGVNTDKNLVRAIDIRETVVAQELQMVTMSEALRGYILAPKNTQEFERKKKGR